MEVAITGSTGLIGSAVARRLEAAGHTVWRMVRRARAPGAREIHWDPERAYVDMLQLSGKDAVVHLAGENIAGRWTPAKKRAIVESRVRGTQVLAEALRQVVKPPQVLISASAVGYYGDRGEEWLTEDSSPGKGFLAETCQQWEAATEPASRGGVRVVVARIGVVLSPAGGALRKMLRPFRMGVGGPVGSGRQYMSWIHIDDVVEAILHAINTPTLQGPVNVVAPQPVPNRAFAKALGRVLRRPAMFPLPAVAVKTIFGQMGEELLLASQRVEPARLKATGFRFRYPELESALRQLLNSPLHL